MGLRSVFIAESLAPEDFYERRTDGFAANEVLRLLGLRTEYRVTLNRELLERAVDEAGKGNFEVFHFSSHGSGRGVKLADGSRIRWNEFARLLKPFSGPGKALVMSTCQGGDAAFTKALVDEEIAFGWVFGSTADVVYFPESCLAWSILYNRLADNGFGRPALKKTLKAINAAIDGDFVYRRLDGKRYLRFPPLPQGG